MTPAVAAYDEFVDSSIVRDIPLDRLTPSPTNPRRHFNAEQLQDLAGDLRQRGVLAPLRVRPIPVSGGDRFEIVFGERRYRAAQIACLATVPCIIGDLTDVEVLELQIAENIQRADMTALEEADAFQRLQDLDPKYREVKVLAAQVGKSVRTVRERMRLLTLVPDVREALDAGEITIGHADLLARIDPAGQRVALKECFYPLYDQGKGARELKSLKEFERWFNDNVTLDVEHEDVQERFPELAGEIAKTAAAGGAIVRLTTWGAGGTQKAKKGEAAILSPSQFREVKAKDTCGVTGVYVLGRERGKIVRVCVDTTCAKHWPENQRKQASPTKSGTASTAGGESKEQKQKRIAKETAERRKRELAQARQEIVATRAIEALLERVGKLESYDGLLRCVLVELLRGDVSFERFNQRFGTKVSWKTTVAELKKLAGPVLVQAVAFCVADQDLNNAYGKYDALVVFPAFNVDVKRIDKDVADEQAAQEKAAATTAATSSKTKTATKKSAKGKKR